MKKIRQILLIDDDEENNFINETLLNELQIAEEVRVVKNGMNALAHIQTCCVPGNILFPELIILDNHMPVMDGVEFMEALNNLPIAGREKMVFVLLAANPTEIDIETFRKLGVQECAAKPLSEKVIMDISQVLA